MENRTKVSNKIASFKAGASGKRFTDTTLEITTTTPCFFLLFLPVQNSLRTGGMQFIAKY
jgi:hypothetical protein